MIKWFEDYITGPTHKWWVENVWHPSWTKFVTAIYGIPAVLLTFWQEIAKFSTDDTIAAYLAKMSVPNWLPMVLAGVALVHYVASGRK